MRKMRPATTTGELLPASGTGDFQTMFLPDGPSQSSGTLRVGRDSGAATAAEARPGAGHFLFR